MEGIAAKCVQEKWFMDLIREQTWSCALLRDLLVETEVSTVGSVLPPERLTTFELDFSSMTPSLHPSGAQLVF